MAKIHPVGGGTQGASFEKTHELFNALITVEVASRIFASELITTQRVFKEITPSRNFWYVAPPEPDAPADLKQITEERRAERRPEDKTYWHRLDEFHRQDRYWRSAIEKAKEAADKAVWELDRPATPPLERTTTAIKRSLQRMGGSVPPPMIIGDYPPVGDEWEPLLRQQRMEVSNWVDELRLLLFPRSIQVAIDDNHRDSQVRATSPEKASAVVPKIDSGTKPKNDRKADPQPGGKGHPPRRKEPKPPKQPKLPSASSQAPAQQETAKYDLLILQVLSEQGATERLSAMKHTTIAEKAIGASASDREHRYVKDRCTEMGRAGLLKAARGTGGGYWITTRGLEALRAATVRQAEGEPHSSSSSLKSAQSG